MLLVQHFYKTTVEVPLISVSFLVGVFDVRQNFMHLVQVVALTSDVQVGIPVAETLVLFVTFKNYLIGGVVSPTIGIC